MIDEQKANHNLPKSFNSMIKQTRIDVFETSCPRQMLVHKGGKIKNWVGSAEMSHQQNCSLKIYLKRALGVGLERVRMDVNEELKFFVKIQKKNIYFFFWGGGGGGRVGGGGLGVSGWM